MDLNIAGGTALKQFTKALTCLSRIGDDLDFSATKQRLSVSTVNSSRTAFGIVHLYPRFFAEYYLVDPDADRPAKFSITAKPFLSTLRTKSAVESVSIAVVDSGDRTGDRHREPGVDSGECRLVVHLFCEHGVRKKHSLTYSDPNVQNWARFDLDACTSSWTASARVLKDWTEHFHLRAGASGAADEITFYCGERDCRLKSFNDSGFDVTNPGDAYASRPLATELHVDVDDYDAYDVPDPQVVTFALREFKVRPLLPVARVVQRSPPHLVLTSLDDGGTQSIITLADSVPASLTAHFSSGGRPLMLQLVGDYFEAKFVVATTDYDSGGGSSVSASASRAATASGSGAARGGAGGGSGASARGPSVAPVKREKSESLPFVGAPRNDRARPGAGAHRPLFNPPTPSPAPAARPAPVLNDDDDDDDEYGGGMDADALGFDDVDALFAEVDQVSQVHLAASQSQRAREPSEAAHRPAVLVSDSTARGGGDENDAEAAWARTTQLGPTQGGARAASGPGAGGGPSGADEREREAKRARWNLMGDS
ncbi:hypothetical protein JCM8208_000304 [Rhodotorula glutinis]